MLVPLLAMKLLHNRQCKHDNDHWILSIAHQHWCKCNHYFHTFASCDESESRHNLHSSNSFFADLCKYALGWALEKESERTLEPVLVLLLAMKLLHSSQCNDGNDRLILNNHRQCSYMCSHSPRIHPTFVALVFHGNFGSNNSSFAVMDKCALDFALEIRLDLMSVLALALLLVTRSWHNQQHIVGKLVKRSSNRHHLVHHTHSQRSHKYSAYDE